MIRVMAATREIRHGDTVEFCTRLPNIHDPIKSPDLNIMGYAWHFSIVAYADKNRLLYLAYIGVDSSRKNFPSRSFQFDFQIGFTDKEYLSLGSGSFEVRSNSHGWVTSIHFWSISESAFKPNLPSYYRSGGIIKFLFCFHFSSEPVLTVKINSRDKRSYLNSDDCSSLRKDLSMILETGMNYDTVIKCGKCTVEAHKLILSARSEVFKAMLQSNMREGRTGTVEIQDMDVNHVQDFVRYLYTDKMPELTLEKAKALYEAGDKYAVKSLMQRCSEYLQDNISAETACMCLVLADTHSDQVLKDSVINYFIKEKAFKKK